jgi:AcrR family transcriptional regulator
MSNKLTPNGDAEFERLRADPRRQRTRDALIRAALELFGQNGLEGVSVDLIIAQAGVSKQTFYNHFADQNALALESWHFSRRGVEQAVARANEGITDPLQRMVRGIAIYARLAVDDPRHARFATQIMSRDVASDAELNAGVVADLSACLAAGRVSVFSTELAVAFIIGTVTALMARILVDANRTLAVVACQQFLNMLLRAFNVPALEAELVAAQAADQVVRQDPTPLLG